MGKKQLFGLVSAMIFICANYAWPQMYPPTIKRPVTFYDFHSDGTNPEFEQPHMTGVHLGMVADTLDSSKKPFLGPAPYLNYGIAKWFRPWVPGDFRVPSYQKVSGGEFDAVMTYAGMITINYDTSYKNIVIQDSLPFQSDPSGSTVIFQYSNENFFPLDGKGFGNEGKNHNYSFAMEFHDSVPSIGGFTLTFGSSDDMWVYINNRLVVDLGGIHQPETSKVVLGTLEGLIPGTLYPIDIYYSERHSPASSVIMSWIAADKPVHRLFLMAAPRSPDTISAGDSVNIHATLVDETGKIHPEFDSLIQWSLFSSPAGTTNRLRTTLGGLNTFYAKQAYTTCIIAASYYVTPTIILRVFDTVYVKPGPVRQFFIEPYTTAISPVPRPVDSIVLGDLPSEMEIYAVLRDAYGNFAGFDTSVTWKSSDTGIVKATASALDKPYVCLVEKVRSGSTYVECNGGGLVLGTVKVIVNLGTKTASPGARSVVQKSAKAIEYFNLRGQKLLLYGIHHADGIVLERVIGHAGKVSIVKKCIPLK